MQKLKVLFFAALVIGTLSCKKSGTSGTTLEITVIDGVTGKPAALSAVVVYATAGDVTGGSPKYSGTTDAGGKIKLTVNYQPQYFILAINGSKRNYYSGLIPVAIFTTQTEIQDSPAQTPTAVIGSVKFQDTNGDGAITSADDVAAPAASIAANTNNTFSTTIY